MPNRAPWSHKSIMRMLVSLVVLFVLFGCSSSNSEPVVDASGVEDAPQASDAIADVPQDASPAIVDASDAGTACPDGTDAGLPKVKYLGPLAAVLPGSDPKIPVSVSTTGWKIAGLGACGGCQACGPITVNIDGHDCDDTAGGHPYNALIVTPTSLVSQPTLMHLGFCKAGAKGTKTVVVELRHDDLTPLKPPVTDQSSVTFN